MTAIPPQITFPWFPEIQFNHLKLKPFNAGAKLIAHFTKIHFTPDQDLQNKCHQIDDIEAQLITYKTMNHEQLPLYGQYVSIIESLYKGISSSSISFSYQRITTNEPSLPIIALGARALKSGLRFLYCLQTPKSQVQTDTVLGTLKMLKAITDKLFTLDVSKYSVILSPDQLHNIDQHLVAYQKHNAIFGLLFTNNGKITNTIIYRSMVTASKQYQLIKENTISAFLQGFANFQNARDSFEINEQYGNSIGTMMKYMHAIKAYNNAEINQYVDKTFKEYNDLNESIFLSARGSLADVKPVNIPDLQPDPKFFQMGSSESIGDLLHSQLEETIESSKKEIQNKLDEITKNAKESYHLYPKDLRLEIISQMSQCNAEKNVVRNLINQNSSNTSELIHVARERFNSTCVQEKNEIPKAQKLVETLDNYTKIESVYFDLEKAIENVMWNYEQSIHQYVEAARKEKQLQVIQDKIKLIEQQKDHALTTFEKVIEHAKQVEQLGKDGETAFQAFNKEGRIALSNVKNIKYSFISIRDLFTNDE